MDSLRFPLLCVLGVLVFFTYQAWTTDQAPQPVAQQAESSQPQSIEDAAAADDVPDLAQSPQAARGNDEASQRVDGAPGSGRGDTPSISQAGPDTAGQRIEVVTDVLRLQIDPAGGTIARAELLDYPASAESDTPLALLSDSGRGFFVAQSGLLGDGAPTHKARFSAQATRYVLGDSETLAVPLTWTDGGGRTVTKTYTFTAGRYVVDVDFRVDNNTAEDWPVSAYGQLWRTLPEDKAGAAPFVQEFEGVAWYEQKDDEAKYRFKKTAYDDLAEEPIDRAQTGGWTAMIEHYFMAALLPPADQVARIVGKPSASRGFVTQAIGERQVAPANGSVTLSQRLFVGPKLQNRLDEIAPGLELAVDYGLLTPLSEPLFWVLDKVHGVLGNWGAAIILLTLAIKLAFYKLSEAQYRSMAKMRKFAPRIQSIKDRFGDDRQAMQKAMMDLYKKEGFNPFAGCWPMLVQFPVFIALYWVLLESVELRQAPFMLWISDLSAPDPFFVLPLLFGVSMFFQQKLSGQAMTMDPMQQKIMTAMPIVLTAFFAFFPAGLVLYWFISNLVGIGQQAYIYKKLDNEGLGRK